jgi:hypothetical protein
MPRNSSGVYSPPSGTAAVSGATIATSEFNNFVNDVGSEITGSVPRNGSAGMSANLPMGGNKVTGLGAPTATGDAFRFDDFFPSGTLMLFQQSAAPTGWTKQTTHNDKALRVVSGSVVNGGTTAFSTMFAAGFAVDTHALTQAEHASFNLSLGGVTVAVSTSETVGTSLSTGTKGTANGGNNCLDAATLNETVVASTGTLGGTLASGGSGTAHGHTANLAVAYVDLIIAAKA